MSQKHTTYERTISRILVYTLREQGKQELQQKTNSKGKNGPTLPRNRRVRRASCATANTTAPFHRSCLNLPSCTQLRHHSNARQRHSLDRFPPTTITAGVAATATATTKPDDPAHSQPLDLALRPRIVGHLDTFHERRHARLLMHPSHDLRSGVGGEDACEL